MKLCRLERRFGWVNKWTISDSGGGLSCEARGVRCGKRHTSLNGVTAIAGRWSGG